MSGEPAPNAGTSFSHGVGGRDFGLAKGRIVLVITGVGSSMISAGIRSSTTLRAAVRSSSLEPGYDKK